MHDCGAVCSAVGAGSAALHDGRRVQGGADAAADVVRGAVERDVLWCGERRPIDSGIGGDVEIDRAGTEAREGAEGVPQEAQEEAGRVRTAGPRQVRGETVSGREELVRWNQALRARERESGGETMTMTVTLIKDKLRSARSIIGAALACALLAAMAGASPAAAEVQCGATCSTWWQVDVQSLPGNLPSGGEGEITVLAEDLGDSVPHGTVVLKDELPEGVTVQKVGLVGTGVSTTGEFYGKAFCTFSAREVTCTLEEGIAEIFLPGPYSNIEAQIKVKVAPTAKSGEENGVSIGGGGAASTTTSTPITVDSTPTTFGLERYELLPENADGSPDTQPGSHPFQLTTDLALNQTGNPEKPPAAVKDLHFNLPPGLIGNPTPFPTCPLSKFLEGVSGGQDLCPDNTAVGVASVSIALPGGSEVGTFDVPLFALVPSVGEPARFGFFIIGDPVYLDTSIRTGGDYGGTVGVDNITEL